MSTPKHRIVAAEGRAKGGRIRKDLLHQQGRRFHSREQKTRRAQGHYIIKQTTEVSHRMKYSGVTMPREPPDLTQDFVKCYLNTAKC